MDTQTKVMIGGGVVIILLGYWWYSTKKAAAAPSGALTTPGSANGGLPSRQGSSIGIGGGQQPPVGGQPLPGQVPSPQPTSSGSSGTGPLPLGGFPGGGTRAPVYGPPVPAAATVAMTRFAVAAPVYAPPADVISALQAQGQLNAIGANPPLAQTGVYDSPTRNAVASFQARMQIPTTGYVDQTTAQDLNTMVQAAKLPGN